MNYLMRSFIAIDVPQELKRNISLLKKDLNFEGIKPVEDENLHITLKFLGDVDSKKLSDVEKALRRVKFKKFKISVRSVGVFPNENYIRVVWVGCESKELIELRSYIEDTLADMFKKEQFNAHLTIARVKRKVDLSAFLNAHRNEDFGEFEVDRFELKMSELSREGPKYSTLASFEALA